MKQMKTLTVNGITYAVTDPTAPRIDDTVLGDAPWSAKKIVDTLCPGFTKTGSIVTCTPVAGYPLEVAADSTVTRCGRNLCSLGTQTFAQMKQCTNAVVLPAGSYYFLADVTTTDTDAVTVSIRFCSKEDGKELVTKYPVHTGGTVKFTFDLLKPADQIYLYASSSWQASAGDTATFSNIQIVPGTKIQDYEPYTGGVFAPGEPVPALPGINTLWAESGAITVTGRSDPTYTATEAGGAENGI